MNNGEKSSLMTAKNEIKLCWVAASDKGGGIIWVADSCCRQAHDNGWNVELLTLVELQDTTKQFISYPTSSLAVKPPFENAPAVFLEWLKVNKPDIIFLNGVDNFNACIDYIPQEIRVVYVIHDNMKFFWRSAIKHLDALDGIIAVAEHTANRFKNKLNEIDKLSIIHNGSRYPAPPQNPEAARNDDIIFVGGSDPRKGAYDLLKLWPALLKNGYKGDLHWYGGLTDALREEIKALPEQKRLHLYSRVARHEIYAAMEACGSLLLLSRAEACSVTVLEAISMGTCVVGWNIEDTGLKEMLPGDLSFTAPLSNFEALANSVLEANSQRSHLAKRLIKRGREDFSELGMWKKYEAVIEKVMARPPAKRPNAGKRPPHYKTPFRASYIVPRWLWKYLRPKIALSGPLYVYLRNKL